jgi:hypothetical protein
MRYQRKIIEKRQNITIIQLKQTPHIANPEVQSRWLLRTIGTSGLAICENVMANCLLP